MLKVRVISLAVGTACAGVLVNQLLLPQPGEHLTATAPPPPHLLPQGHGDFWQTLRLSPR